MSPKFAKNALIRKGIYHSIVCPSEEKRFPKFYRMIYIFPSNNIFLFYSREELEEKLNYNNMPIYVRKLSAADKCDDPDFSGFDSWEQPTDASSTIDSVEDVENSSKYD